MELVLLAATLIMVGVVIWWLLRDRIRYVIRIWPQERRTNRINRIMDSIAAGTLPDETLKEVNRLIELALATHPSEVARIDILLYEAERILVFHTDHRRKESRRASAKGPV